MDYKQKIDVLERKIHEACARAHRDPGEVTIIAATKYADYTQIQKLVDCGINSLGENRADQLVKKSEKVKGDPRWHFIGHLQSRKSKMVVPIAEYIHSIDTISTLAKVGKEAAKIRKVQKVLVQINVSGEASKFGINPQEVDKFLTEGEAIEHTAIKGFMTMAPLTDDRELIRNIFRNLRALLQECNSKLDGCSLTELSMGMSNDYQIAIEEGATMIRVGSVLFK